MISNLYVSMIQEGFAWVLLDGGPSRAFSDSDVVLMEDDLTMLKVFVILSSSTES